MRLVLLLVPEVWEAEEGGGVRREDGSKKSGKSIQRGMSPGRGGAGCGLIWTGHERRYDKQQQRQKQVLRLRRQKRPLRSG